DELAVISCTHRAGGDRVGDGAEIRVDDPVWDAGVAVADEDGGIGVVFDDITGDQKRSAAFIVPEGTIEVVLRPGIVGESTDGEMILDSTAIIRFSKSPVGKGRSVVVTWNCAFIIHPNPVSGGLKVLLDLESTDPEFAFALVGLHKGRSDGVDEFV